MGLANLLVSAIIKHVVGQIFDVGFPTSKVVNSRLLFAKTPNSLLFGITPFLSQQEIVEEHFLYFWGPLFYLNILIL